MPVTRDPRYVATCARVNNQNVKVGKARSFKVREAITGKISIGTMWNSFLLPVWTTSSGQRLPSCKDWMPTASEPKEQQMDWLVGIHPGQVVETAYAVLDRGGFVYQILENRFCPFVSPNTE
jgi:hypothetical protein